MSSMNHSLIKWSDKVKDGQCIMENEQLVRLMKKLEDSFIPEKAAGMGGVFQCHVLGVANGDWLMTVGDAKCQITPGTVDQPRATLEIANDDLKNLLNGTLDPMKAFFSGRIDLKGDVSSVIKLLSMFRLNPDRFK